MPSKCRGDVKQENVNNLNVTLQVKHELLDSNGVDVDSLNSSCNKSVHFLLLKNEANTSLSISCDIAHNMNHVDQTGRLQNACPMLRAAHFGFTKLGLSSRYKLADFSHKLPASSFEKWTVQAFDIVKRMGLPNYRGACIEVNTSLNLDVWHYILKDPQLFDYLRFGFPLSINYDMFSHNSEIANHASATNFPQDVDIYIRTELQHNALAGPLKTMPFKPFHCFSLLSHPKEGDSGRIIVNLSYPLGNSVNSNIPAGTRLEMSLI